MYVDPPLNCYHCFEIPVESSAGRHAPRISLNARLFEVRYTVEVGSNDGNGVARRNEESVLTDYHVPILKQQPKGSFTLSESKCEVERELLPAATKLWPR